MAANLEITALTITPQGGTEFDLKNPSINGVFVDKQGIKGLIGIPQPRTDIKNNLNGDGGYLATPTYSQGRPISIVFQVRNIPGSTQVENYRIFKSQLEKMMRAGGTLKFQLEGGATYTTRVYLIGAVDPEIAITDMGDILFFTAEFYAPDGNFYDLNETSVEIEEGSTATVATISGSGTVYPKFIIPYNSENVTIDIRPSGIGASYVRIFEHEGVIPVGAIMLDMSPATNFPIRKYSDNTGNATLVMTDVLLKFRRIKLSGGTAYDIRFLRDSGTGDLEMTYSEVF